MEFSTWNEIEERKLVGRGVRQCVGATSPIKSDNMTFGRTLFSLKYGAMEPHHHAEELIYVCDCRNGIVRWGDTPECKSGSKVLEPGMTLHFKSQEWHVFEFTKEDGYSDILFFYSQTNDIRPEK